jgi:hypothetical protein
VCFAVEAGSVWFALLLLVVSCMLGWLCMLVMDVFHIRSFACSVAAAVTIMATAFLLLCEIPLCILRLCSWSICW